MLVPVFAGDQLVSDAKLDLKVVFLVSISIFSTCLALLENPCMCDLGLAALCIPELL